MDVGAAVIVDVGAAVVVDVAAAVLVWVFIKKYLSCTLDG